MTDFTTARELNNRVSSAHRYWHEAKVFREDEELRGTIASLLAYSVRDKVVEHVDVFIEDIEDSESVVRVVVFTEADIVVLEKDPGRDARCTVIPRSEVATVGFLAVPNLLVDSSFGHTGEIVLELTFSRAIREALVIGQDRGLTSRNAADLLEFSGQLLADLHSK